MDEMELRAHRAEVALEKGIPARHAKRLSGSTREELEADADALLVDMGGTGTGASAGTSGFGAAGRAAARERHGDQAGAGRAGGAAPHFDSGQRATARVTVESGGTAEARRRYGHRAGTYRPVNRPGALRAAGRQ